MLVLLLLLLPLLNAFRFKGFISLYYEWPQPTYCHNLKDFLWKVASLRVLSCGKTLWRFLGSYVEEDLHFYHTIYTIRYCSLMLFSEYDFRTVVDQVFMCPQLGYILRPMGFLWSETVTTEELLIFLPSFLSHEAKKIGTIFLNNFAHARLSRALSARRGYIGRMAGSFPFFFLWKIQENFNRIEADGHVLVETEPGSSSSENI